MQLLEPLRVIDVRLPPWHLLDVAGIDQHDLEAASLKDLEYGNPVHARGFHGDRRDPDGMQPVGERVQVTTKRREGPDRCRVTVRCNRHDVMCRPDIDTGGVRIDRGKRIRRSTSRALRHRTPPRMSRGRGGALEHFPKRDHLAASPLTCAQATPGPCFLAGS